MMTGGHRSLRFLKGPIFAQIILADEINRTPPKTQAALLEAMQEYHVTAAGRTYELERPFFVLATQNPIELEGTYPLPEAQLDRFMFNVVMTYLDPADEVRVVTQTTGAVRPAPSRVLDGVAINAFQTSVRDVLVADEVAQYAVRLVDTSRPGRGAKPAFVEKWVKWGAGLRASQALILGSKARALMHGRHHVSVKDIQALAKPILRHRVIPNFYAEAEGISSDQIVESVARRRARARERAMWRRSDGVRDALRFLDPATLARLGSLELKARAIVEGFLTGLHRSPFKGFSVEFAEYRQYLPGDDLATLDWKVYGRTDRHFIKKFEEETNLDCHILLDVSASMGYKSGSITKLQYGSYLAAALAYLMNRQRDAAGLMAFDDKIVKMVRPSARSGHLTSLLVTLEKLQLGALTNVAKPLRDLAEAIRKRGLVVLISDLLDDPDRVLQGLKHFRFRGTEVIVFHILDPAELGFPFEQPTRFRDMETSEEVVAVPSVVREQYLQAIGELQERYRRELQLAGIDYVMLDTSVPLESGLMSYLLARRRAS